MYPLLDIASVYLYVVNYFLTLFLFSCIAINNAPAFNCTLTVAVIIDRISNLLS